jgi:hypothetical protein
MHAVLARGRDVEDHHVRLGRKHATKALRRDHAVLDDQDP